MNATSFKEDVGDLGDRVRPKIEEAKQMNRPESPGGTDA